jgi:hypothetical protein
MTKEEIQKVLDDQAEWRRFTATVAGDALQGFRNALITETVDGENERISVRKHRENIERTASYHEKLVSEIKRLQSLEKKNAA